MITNATALLKVVTWHGRALFTMNAQHAQITHRSSSHFTVSDGHHFMARYQLDRRDHYFGKTMATILCCHFPNSDRQ